MILTPQTFAEIGVALFGANWHTPLAKRLGVNRRTITRWLQGEPMPANLRARLSLIAEDRLVELARYSEELRAAA